jgi:gliding motility-associated-like protein
LKKAFSILLIILFFSSLNGYSQSIINSYTRIRAICCVNKPVTDKDSVVVDNPGFFNEGDTVLIHFAKSAGWNYNAATWNGYGFAGKFEYQLIDTIIGDTIVFKSFLEHRDTVYTILHAAQLIKVPTFKILKTTGLITASAWDGQKGGILAFITDTLDLGADIDVTGKGFAGANPKLNTSVSICARADSVDMVKGNYAQSSKDSSGLKGESVVAFNSSYMRGLYPVANGGGGGNGKNAGGGGGGGFRYGGRGDDEDNTTCIAINARTGGNGQVQMKDLKDGFLADGFRAAFGGGGGASVDNPGASIGGNGGGIIIAMVNVLKGNGYKIVASGDSVQTVATTGAGGGGGGGAIFLDVNQYVGTLNVWVRGGKGGNTTANGGSGGGGGAGYVWFNDASLPSGVTISATGGSYGISRLGQKNAIAGSAAGITNPKYNLLMPTKAFLFNIMPKNQEICAGEAPQKLDASVPKGGSGPGTYTFEWYHSTNLSSWTLVGNQEDYQPPVLYDTTYYRRTVKSGTTVDNGTILIVNVLPAITNNIISSDTILCYGTAFPALKGNNPGAGNGSYTYLWQDKVLSWHNAEGINDTLVYISEHDTTTLFRRIVKSGVCTDTSNYVTIRVLPSLTNNMVTANQWVSEGQVANPLTGSIPVGGDTTFRYKWLKSTNAVSWVSATGVNNLIDYTVPLLPDTTFYKRVVFSGHSDCCIDTSSYITINILDSIQNNTIAGNATICGLTAPSNFTGTQPFGGNGKYFFLWQKSYNQTVWADERTVEDTLYYNPGVMNTSAWFRRIALSGPGYCCKDTSNSIKIDVRPYIKNNTISIQSNSLNDTIICNNQTVNIINGLLPIDGDGAYNYLWQYSINAAPWSNAPGTFNQQSFTSGTFLANTKIRRRVTSGVCQSYSDTVSITVLPKISNNTIPANISVCINTVPEIYSGSTPSGGNSPQYNYQWLSSLDNASWSVVGNAINYQAGLTNTETYYKRIVTSGLHNCCIDTSNNLTVNINNRPTIALTPFIDSICVGETYTLYVNITGQQPYSFNYSDGTDLTLLSGISENAHSFDISPSLTKTYNISSLTDGNGCEAQTLTGVGTLHVFEVPNSNAGLDTSVCGLAVHLNALPSVGNGIWTSVSIVDFEDVIIPNPLATVNTYGNHTFVFTETNGVCIDSDEVEVTFFEQPVNVDAGVNVVDTFLFKTTLNASVPEIGTGNWSCINPNVVFDAPESPFSNVSNLKLGENYLVWTIDNGVCNVIKDSVLLNIKDIRVPEGFSPNNGDLINQFFEIYGLENIENAELIVFNKWGNEVFSSTNYKNNWAGTANGIDLPMDVYYYILRAVGRTYKGSVIIKR